MEGSLWKDVCERKFVEGILYTSVLAGSRRYPLGKRWNFLRVLILGLGFGLGFLMEKYLPLHFMMQENGGVGKISMLSYYIHYLFEQNIVCVSLFKVISLYRATKFISRIISKIIYNTKKLIHDTILPSFLQRKSYIHSSTLSFFSTIPYPIILSFKIVLIQVFLGIICI